MWRITFAATRCIDKDHACFFSRSLQLLEIHNSQRSVTVTPIDKAFAVAEAALEKKAYDLVVLEAEHLSSIADYFVIATGRSDVQVQSIARGIDERMGAEGKRPLSVEGLPHAHWVVLDYDDVVIHVFYEPAREFYRLEANWSDAREIPLPEPYRSQAADLRLRAIG